MDYVDSFHVGDPEIASFVAPMRRQHRWTFAAVGVLLINLQTKINQALLVPDGAMIGFLSLE
jgi:hypothetical protein